MKISLIILLGLFCSVIFAFSQQVKIPKLSFKQLEPYLNKQTDTLYLVNFWATWCAPCREEMPAIQKIHEKYSGKNVKILLVSLDMPSQMESRLIPYIRKNKITPDVVLLDDPRQNEWIDKVDPDWSGSLPFTIIYSAESRQTFDQPFTYEKLDSIIQLKVKRL